MVAIFRKVGVANEIYRISCWKSSDQGQELIGRSYGEVGKYEDAEDVVKELEDLKMSYFLTLANTGDVDKDCAYLNIANAIDRAIEIVKRGGRDEE